MKPKILAAGALAFCLLGAVVGSLVLGTGVASIGQTPPPASGGGGGDLLAANNLSDLASATTSRNNLGLGTAATVNTGVANGNVPLMDGTGYPAADGSQITGISHSNAGPTPAVTPDYTFNPGLSVYKTGGAKIQGGGSSQIRTSMGYPMYWKDNTSANYVEVPSGVITRSANFTVIAAVRPSSLASTGRPFGSRSGGGGLQTSWAAVRFETDGRLRGFFGDDTNSRTTETDDPVLTADEMTVISMSYSAGDTTVKLWVDGDSKAVSSIAGTATAATGTGYAYGFGRWGDYSVDNMEGWYGIAWIWNSTLTDPQVVTASNLLMDYYGIP